MKYPDKELEPRKTMGQQPNAGRGGTSPDRLENTFSSWRLFALVLYATQQRPPTILPNPNDRHNTLLLNPFHLFHFVTSTAMTTNPTLPNAHIILCFFMLDEPYVPMKFILLTIDTFVPLLFLLLTTNKYFPFPLHLNLLHSQCTNTNLIIEGERQGNTKKEM